MLGRRAGPVSFCVLEPRFLGTGRTSTRVSYLFTGAQWSHRACRDVLYDLTILYLPLLGSELSWAAMRVRAEPHSAVNYDSPSDDSYILKVVEVGVLPSLRHLAERHHLAISNGEYIQPYRDSVPTIQECHRDHCFIDPIARNISVDRSSDGVSNPQRSTVVGSNLLHTASDSN